MGLHAWGCKQWPPPPCDAASSARRVLHARSAAAASAGRCISDPSMGTRLRTFICFYKLRMSRSFEAPAG